MAQSQTAGPLNVDVTSTSDIVCSITNTRKTGKLEVRKTLSPANDPGKFNLQIDGTTAGTGGNVGDGGTTGERNVNTGTRTVGETAGTSTDLDNYTSSIVCKADNGNGATVAQSQTAGPLNVDVTSTSDIVCTITNTRIQNKVELVKKWVNAKEDDARSTGDYRWDHGSRPRAQQWPRTVRRSKPTLTSMKRSPSPSSSQARATTTKNWSAKSDGKPVNVANYWKSTMPNKPVTCTFTNTRTTLKL